jgi:DNA-binding MarR family transcriptional regulator
MNHPDIRPPETASDLAQLVSLASRFFNGMSNWKPFVDVDIDLPQWALLAEIKARDGTNIARLARLLGISRQHTFAIAETLEEMGFLTFNDAQHVDAKLVSITEAGEERLSTLNAEIERILDELLGEKRHLVRAVSGFFSLLLKITAEEQKRPL